MEEMADEKLSKQWEDTCHEARKALESFLEHFNELRDLHEQYQDWRNEMPEHQEGSETAETLETLINDVEGFFYKMQGAVDKVESSLDDVEQVQLPDEPSSEERYEPDYEPAERY